MIESLDHLVLTVSNLEGTIRFYEALGMRHEVFNGDRHALHFGRSKINLHPVNKPSFPLPAHPTPGSADLCFLVATTPEEVEAHLLKSGIEILEGPVPRTGAQGPLTSYYVLDPDRNLIELSTPTH